MPIFLPLPPLPLLRLLLLLLLLLLGGSDVFLSRQPPPALGDNKPVGACETHKDQYRSEDAQTANKTGVLRFAALSSRTIVALCRPVRSQIHVRSNGAIRARTRCRRPHHDVIGEAL
jgi:hypothetical protein